jgi:hypothetical protein
VRAFLDSKILAYAFSSDRRRDRTLSVAAEGGVINAQTLS